MRAETTIDLPGSGARATLRELTVADARALVALDARLGGLTIAEAMMGDHPEVAQVAGSCLEVRMPRGEGEGRGPALLDMLPVSDLMLLLSEWRKLPGNRDFFRMASMIDALLAMMDLARDQGGSSTPGSSTSSTGDTGSPGPTDGSSSSG